VKGVLGMHNYSYLWLRGDSRLTAEEIADEFTDVMLRGLLSDADLVEFVCPTMSPPKR
jgi:hypothetical protein